MNEAIRLSLYAAGGFRFFMHVYIAINKKVMTKISSVITAFYMKYRCKKGLKSVVGM